MTGAMRYAVVTPARDEAANLPRLAASLAAQTVLPEVWIVVDNGSTDGTPDLCRQLERAHSWSRLLEIPGARAARRGGAAVRAFSAGVASLADLPEIVVNLDADVSMQPDYFEHVLEAFQTDRTLGIASGTCLELEDGEWRPQHVTRDHARGAARAYRRECLQEVMPLVESVAWDGIDELKARTRGWRVRSFPDLPVRHHRALGRREARLAVWTDEGEMSHFMGYRPSYLVIRTGYQALRDPAAVAMLYGYGRAVFRRSARYEDPAVRKLLRDEQSLRRLPRRIREARGRA
jgi:glycosyltransferase involved in cell wall biosynthesis